MSKKTFLKFISLILCIISILSFFGPFGADRDEHYNVSGFELIRGYDEGPKSLILIVSLIIIIIAAIYLSLELINTVYPKYHIDVNKVFSIEITRAVTCIIFAITVILLNSFYDYTDYYTLQWGAILSCALFAEACLIYCYITVCDMYNIFKTKNETKNKLSTETLKEDLLNLKQLLDEGLLTEEEYSEKKKQLLKI